MKGKKALHKDLSDASKCKLLKEASEINVAGSNVAICITGKLDHSGKESDPESTAFGVDGDSLIEKIDIKTTTWEQKNDLELTGEILNAFKWNWNTLNDTLKVKVVNGWVMLSGELEWNYQREAAKTVARDLIGVKGVTNLITIRSNDNIKVHKAIVERMLNSHVEIDATNIIVDVSGSNVILKGSVDSSLQKELAGHIVWKVPGIINVVNELLVEKKQL